MAIFRKIETTFWSEDAFILDLDKEQKYFYLYLLTNPNVNQSGCYEISKRTMSFQTGFTVQEIDDLLSFFCDANKIKYDAETSEILINNWFKYNASESPKLIKNIVESIEKVKNEDFRKYCMDTLSILYPNNDELKKYSIHTESTVRERVRVRERVKERVINTHARTRENFCPPSLEEIKAYALERSSKVDPVKFFEFYQTGNWTDSKGQKVKNWKQKFITWENKEPKSHSLAPREKESQLERAAKRLGVV